MLTAGKSALSKAVRIRTLSFPRFNLPRLLPIDGKKPPKEAAAKKAARGPA